MHGYNIKSRCIPINVKITSVTRHQQFFSMRNTKIIDGYNAAPIVRGGIGAAWHLPERNPKTGVAVRREWFANACCFSFVV
jgi:hypothetical protein